jgi:transposase
LVPTGLAVSSRHRGIKTVNPEPADQAAHRRRRGLAGGRPISYDPAEYRGRNVIERGIDQLKTWRALATRYDKHALTYRGGLTSPPSSAGPDDFGDVP